MAGRKPGAAKTGGRVKGTPNKVTGELKDMILSALSQSGGVDYLVRQAEEKPVAFLALVGKVLPLQVNGELEHKGGITVNIKHY
jgi:hypothetical protein